MCNQKLFHNLRFIMKKILFLITFFGFYFSTYSQSMENKKVLVVWGGWDGHQPKVFADNVIKWLKSNNSDVYESNDLTIYDNYESLVKFDLIIQSVTMGEITSKQVNNLTKAVKNGVGIAGAHGGLADSFRNSTPYQFMIGGQWVEHPGGKIDYTVNVLDTNDPISDGIKDFEIKDTEQYYMHIDPNTKVLATTKFTDSIHERFK